MHDIDLESHYDCTDLYAFELPEDSSKRPFQISPAELAATDFQNIPVIQSTTNPLLADTFHTRLSDGSLEAEQVEEADVDEVIAEVVILGPSKVVVVVVGEAVRRVRFLL
jgi:hypothetical protein